MKTYANIESPLGRILLVSDGTALTGVHFSGQRYEPTPGPDWRYEPASKILRKAALQLEEYFAGRRRAFQIPLRFHGTPFKVQVWNALCEIPWGVTISYGELARRVGRAGAARAVGGAVGRNPISVIVPCHRVIGQDGSLTGYGGGLERKRALLTLEATMVKGQPE